MTEDNKGASGATTERTFNAPKPKIANLRETERTLQSARRARRRAFNELCRLRREYRENNKAVPKELTDELETLRHFANLEGR